MSDSNHGASEAALLPLLDLQIDWSTPFSEDTWTRLAAIGEPSQVTRVRIGPVFEYPSPKMVTEIVGKRPSDGSDSSSSPTRASIDLHLHCRRTPGSEPPDWAVAADQRAGKREGLAHTLSLLTPSPSPVAFFSFSLDVDAGTWSSDVVRRRPPAGDPVVSLDESATIEEAGYRLKAGPLGLTELVITYLHETNVYRVRILGKGVLDAPQTVLSYPRSLLRLVMETTFREAR